MDRWSAERTKRVLPVGHFHVVFTLASEMRGLARYRPKAYDTLFRCGEQLADGVGAEPR